MDSRLWLRAREIVEEALDHPPGERRAVVEDAAGDDGRLQAVALELLEQTLDDEPWPRPPELVDPELEGDAPERAGDWQLGEQLGAGGMGTVYLGERLKQGIAQRAAVKLLKRGIDTDELLARFRREGRLLARLEHPGIARLIDGGATADGRPYLAMEYVEGDHIHRWCDARKLDVAGRLALFREVCTAVQYAHSRLVVHRDLKPSNILVGTGGRPRLLDFGIAKVLGEDADPEEREDVTTQARPVPLTPEYASPEQVRGEAVTTASDVYSLGAVLYQLLTGSRAHRITTRTPLEIERAVCETPPTPPSAAVLASAGGNGGAGSDPITTAGARGASPRALSRELEGDLDRIVMKALHKDPARRYTSVEQFSEDLRRFELGLPVLARPDSFGYRASRFLARNRLPVGGALVLLGVILFAWWNSDRLYRGAVDAREAEREQRELAQTRLVDATKAQQAEARQRGLAEQRFDDIRDLATDVILDMARELRDYPGSLELRERIVREASLRLDALAESAVGDSTLLLELAGAYLNLGALQGGERSTSLGQLDEAQVSLGKLDGVLAELRSLDPAPELHELTARRDWLAGLIAAQRGDAQAGTDLLELAVANTPRGSASWARVRNALAGHYFDVGEYERALDEYTETEKVLRQEHERAPDAATRIALAGCLLQRGHTLRNLQRFAQAEPALREVQGLMREMLDTEPTHMNARLILAGAEQRLGVLLTQRRAPGDEGEKLLLSAVASLEELVAIDERWLEPRDFLIGALFNLGEHAILDKQYEAALEYHRRGEQACLERLSLASGVEPERGLAAARDRVGTALLNLGRFEEAREALLKARLYLEPRAAASDLADEQRDLAVNCYLLGATHRVMANGDPPPENYIENLELAHGYWSESVEILRALDERGQLMERDRVELEHQAGELITIEGMIEKVLH